jgi:hypothetical protein
VRDEAQAVKRPIDLLLSLKPGPLSEQQRELLNSAHMALQRLARVTEKTVPPLISPLKKKQ